MIQQIFQYRCFCFLAVLFLRVGWVRGFIYFQFEQSLLVCFVKNVVVFLICIGGIRKRGFFYFYQIVCITYRSIRLDVSKRVGRRREGMVQRRVRFRGRFFYLLQLWIRSKIIMFVVLINLYWIGRNFFLGEYCGGDFFFISWRSRRFFILQFFGFKRFRGKYVILLCIIRCMCFCSLEVFIQIIRVIVRDLNGD